MSKGLGQTSNSSWSEPNSNLGGPKISLRSSNFRCVEPINWIRSVKKGFPNEAKYTLSYKFYFFFSLFLRMWRSTFFPPTIFRRYIRLKQMNRTCLAIQTHPDELNWAGHRTFHELNSLTLVRLMQCLTFGLALILQLLYGFRMIWRSRSGTNRSVPPDRFA